MDMDIIILNQEFENEDQPSSFEEKIKEGRKKLLRETRAKKKDILYYRELVMLSYLQEPKNKHEITLKVSFHFHQDLRNEIDKLLKSGIIQQVEYNPNKYKLTPRGLYCLHRIKQLNKLVNNNLDKVL